MLGTSLHIISIEELIIFAIQSVVDIESNLSILINTLLLMKYIITQNIFLFILKIKYDYYLCTRKYYVIIFFQENINIRVEGKLNDPLQC